MATNASLKHLDSDEAEKLLAAYSFTEDTLTKLLSRVVLSNGTGSEISPATEATLQALSAKFAALVNGAAPVTITPRSNNAYSANFIITPVTTLTTGTIYAAITVGSGKTVSIKRIVASLTFTGTAAAGTRSVFAITRFTASGPSGTGVTVMKRKSDNASSVVTAAQTQSGMSGSPTLDATPLKYLQIPSQNTASPVLVWDLQDSPIQITENEGLVVAAVGTLIAGVSLNLGVEWNED